LQLPQNQNNLSENHRSIDHPLESLELQPIPSTSRIINVAPIHLAESDKAPRNESDPQTIEIPNDPGTSRIINVAPMHLLESEKARRNESDLQTKEIPNDPSTSRVINGAPIHLAESDEALRNESDTIMIEIPNNPSTSRIINVAPIHVVESDETPRNESDLQTIEISNVSTNSPYNPVGLPPSTQVFCLNTIKYNRNLISLTGSIFLTLSLIAAISIAFWNVHVSGDVRNTIVQWYVAQFLLSVGLPALYFTLNPRHLIIAVQDLPCSR
jgi:hypothetical protein